MAAGSIVVDLLMRTGSFETDTKRAEKSLKQLEKTVDDIAKTITTGFATAAAALSALVVKTTQSAEEINRFAQLSGASAESFQRFAAGAESVGISQEKLADQFKDFREKVGEFLQTGGGGMRDFFEQIAPRIGVTADQFRRLSGPEALQLYVNSLEKAGLSQEEMSFYLESMASDTTALIPLLRNGGQAMQEFGDRAQATGRIMSEDLIRQSVDFQKSLKEISGSLTSLAISITQELLPTLQILSNELLKIENGTSAASIIGKAFRVILETVSVVAANLAFVLNMTYKEIVGIKDQLIALATLDFKGFANIGDKMRREAATARAELDALENRLMGFGAGAGAGRGFVNPPMVVPGAATLPGIPSAAKPSDTSKARNVIDDAQRTFDAIQKQINALTLQAATFNMTEKAAVLYKMALDGATQGQINRAEAVLDEIEALKENKKAIDEVIDAESRMTQILEQDRLDAQNKIIAAQERLNELLGLDVLERQRADMELLAEAFQKGRINVDEYNNAVYRTLGINGELQKETEKSKGIAEELGMTFTSAFEDAILAGKGLSDTLRGLAQDILRIAARKLITEPLAAGITGAIQGAFGGARAGGGDVIGGRSYLVGENGPEMFTPRTTGTITPSGAAGGATIVQNINVTTGVQQTVRAEILSLMPQIANATKSAVADAKLRGGSYAAALR